MRQDEKSLMIYSTHISRVLWLFIAVKQSTPKPSDLKQFIITYCCGLGVDVGFNWVIYSVCC